MAKYTEVAAAIKKTILKRPDEFSVEWVFGGSAKIPPFWANCLDNYPEGCKRFESTNEISTYFSRNKRKIRDILINDPDLKALQSSDNAQNVDLPTSVLDYMTRQDTAKMIEEALSNRLSELSMPKHYEQNELVPEPTTIIGGSKGRRMNRRYVKKTITIDKNLWLLFEKEVNELNIPVSRLIDTILWLRYDKPKLTVE
jgi:hypothetical protein